MVKQEIKALQVIKARQLTTGEVSPLIACTRPGTLVFDRHLWELLLLSDDPEKEWDIDEHFKKMVVIHFHNRNTFIRAYRTTRLIRGRLRGKVIR